MVRACGAYSRDGVPHSEDDSDTQRELDMIAPPNPLKKKVVIDHDILGWGDEHRAELLREYEGILQVSKHPDLPQRSFDDKIAAYCKQNGCDLMTGDAKCYTHFFDAGIGMVWISRRAWWTKGDRPVYLVQIVG